jgi:hypothetical protein
MPPAPSGAVGALFKMGTTLETVVKALSRYVIPVAPMADNAKVIYNWITENIEYDNERKKSIDDKLDKGLPYEPDVVIGRKKGVCSDMALLYVAIAKEFGIKAHYAHVDIDCKGEDVSHACAAIKTQTGQMILIDPAYRQFDIKHQKYQIVEPNVQNSDGVVIPKPKKKIKLVRALAAGIMLFYGICSYLLNSSGSTPPQNTGLSLLETCSEARFVSQNGAFRFSFEKEAGTVMKECIFFCEAKQGALSDKAILEKYVQADRNRDGIISIEESGEARKSARESYFSKKN